MSEAETLDEITRVKELMSSQLWRLNNLYYIKDASGAKVKFRMNWAQRELFRGLHYYNVILKARQLGFTTFVMIYFLDACLFEPNHSAGVIAHTKDAATALFKDKIKFAYDNLPEWMRKERGSKSDSAQVLEFSNGSKIMVGTSLRSGTFQKLLISEFGKTSAREPEKAVEIKTGALNTVHSGQQIFIESTAEGESGEFYDICQIARLKQQRGDELTSADPKFFFFPWYAHPAYTLSEKDAALTTISREMDKYFHELNITLTAGQKAWYVKKREQQGDSMMREFPSTPDEAFRGSLKGAYYLKEVGKIRAEKRVCRVPYESSRLVHTFWDLGNSDAMSVVFFQHIGMEYRFIDYWEGSKIGGIAGAIKVLRLKDYIYGTHHWPWDGGNEQLLNGKKLSTSAEELGLRPIKIVQRTKSLNLGIERVRPILNRGYFDADKCALLIKHIESYREKWDRVLGNWSGQPLHDDASHAVAALRTFADGYDGRGSEFVDRDSGAGYADSEYDMLGA